MEQVRDVLDVYAALMPDYQVMMQVDHSAGHAAKKEGALNTNTMNAGPGGAQAHLRRSTMTAGCIGPHPAVMTLGDGTVVDCKLQAGDVQEFNFPAAAEAGRPAVPFFDRQPDNPAHYFGMAKGMKQVLFERGWWPAEMGGPRGKQMNKDDQMVALDMLPDFLAETSAFETSLNSCGHFGLLSPKGHPEMAGQGVEYCWGKAKQYYRRHNTMDNKTFKQRVKVCMDATVLDMERVRKFARRARAYRNGYKQPELAGSYLGIERLVKRSKAHRCTLDQAYSFIMNA